MKKLILLICSLVLALAACGDVSEPETQPDSISKDQACELGGKGDRGRD